MGKSMPPVFCAVRGQACGEAQNIIWKGLLTKISHSDIFIEETYVPSKSFS